MWWNPSAHYLTKFESIASRLLPQRSTSAHGAVEAEHENAPGLTGRGRSLYLEHETGLEPATPTLAREDEPEEPPVQTRTPRKVDLRRPETYRGQGPRCQAEA